VTTALLVVGRSHRVCILEPRTAGAVELECVVTYSKTCAP